MNHRTNRSHFLFPLVTAAIWLASQQIATAQTLLAPTLIAQTGTTKTLIGWAIVALCIGLGLLVVCRTSIRTPPKKKHAAKK